MRHKENHQQPCALKCIMCNYTNKNKARLTEHKEKHKDKELMKFYRCNFAEEDQSLMQKHKESHKEIRTKVSDVWQYPSKLATGSHIDDRPSTISLGIVSVGW